MSQTICISREDLNFLQTFIKKGTHEARELIRAEILILLHERKNIITIANRTRRSTKTVIRIQARYNKGGIQRAVFDAPRSGQPRKTSITDDAHLVAIACTKAPRGSNYWTLDFLTKQFEKKRGEKLGRTAIWLRLKTRSIKPWREKNVVYTESY